MTMLLAALLVASNPAVAPEQQAQTQPAPVAAPAAVPQKKERKICRDDPSFTGTRLVKQICKTKSEWEGTAVGQATEGASN